MTSLLCLMLVVNTIGIGLAISAILRGMAEYGIAAILVALLNCVLLLWAWRYEQAWQRRMRQ